MRHFTAKFAVRRLANLAIDYVFPDGNVSCVLCHRPLFPPGALPRIHQQTDELAKHPGVCLFCEQELSSIHVAPVVRPMRVRVGNDVALVDVMSALRHEGIVRRAIRQWKYDGLLTATRWLSEWVVGGLRLSFDPLEVDAITWVPTSLHRLRMRGYDHAQLLALEVASSLDKPLYQWLTRGTAKDSHSEPTWSQTARNKSGRQTGANHEYRLVRNVELEGKHILLVDDIVTTGSTLQACTRALLEGGAKSVLAATVAFEV